MRTYICSCILSKDHTGFNVSPLLTTTVTFVEQFILKFHAIILCRKLLSLSFSLSTCLCLQDISERLKAVQSLVGEGAEISRESENMMRRRVSSKP